MVVLQLLDDEVGRFDAALLLQALGLSGQIDGGCWLHGPAGSCRRGRTWRQMRTPYCSQNICGLRAGVMPSPETRCTRIVDAAVLHQRAIVLGRVVEQLALAQRGHAGL